jgi:hypothetical protein
MKDHRVRMAQNAQELLLTTPVRFYGKWKDVRLVGKDVRLFASWPKAFLMELETRQTRDGWEPSKLLRLAKSCLRGKAALWWECCIHADGEDQDQGPAENYAAFEVAFKKHNGISGVTNNLGGAETACNSRGELQKDPQAATDAEAATLGAGGVKTQVLFYGEWKEGKSIPPNAFQPNAFLRELETDATRMGVQYDATVRQVVPEGRSRIVVGRLHSLLRGGPWTGREL